MRRYFPAQRKYLDTLRPRDRAEAVVVNTDPEHPVLLLAELAPCDLLDAAVSAGAADT
jgi:hypothetical protein